MAGNRHPAETRAPSWPTPTTPTTGSSAPSSPTPTRPPACSRQTCPPPSATASTFDKLRWTTLTLRSGTFIDEELRASQSDLLFHVTHAGSGQPVSMYVLLEHQSSPDHWLRLRLLRNFAESDWLRLRLLRNFAESGRPTCATTRSGASCGRSYRWCSTKANAVGPTRPSSPTCSMSTTYSQREQICWTKLAVGLLYWAFGYKKPLQGMSRRGLAIGSDNPGLCYLLDSKSSRSISLRR